MTPWITKPVPFNIGQGAAAAGAAEPVVSWSQTTSDDGVQCQYDNAAETQKLGQTILNESLIVGTELKKITFRMINHFSSALTYRINCKVWNNSGVAQAVSETVVNLDDLQTAWSDPADRVTFTFDSPVEILQDWIFGIEPEGGDFNASSVIFRVNMSSVVVDTQMDDYRNGSWGTVEWAHVDAWLIAYEPG